MDTKPQSSFIPKKPAMAGTLSRSGGLFPFLANTIFVVALIASVAVFAYDKFLSARISKMDESLSAARTALQPELITQLVRSDKRIISANALIQHHVTISSFFEVLQELTLQNVQFTSFSFGTGETGGLSINMKGEARSYATVALQAKIFSENDNFINPQFSNLDLSEKGDVVFNFKSQLNPKVISYTASLQTETMPAGEPSDVPVGELPVSSAPVTPAGVIPN